MILSYLPIDFFENFLHKYS